jgi:hypothetical protein
VEAGDGIGPPRHGRSFRCRSGKWIVQFHRVRTSVYIALLGLLFGLTVHQPARTVVWIVAGLVATGLYIANVAKKKRHERMLNKVGAGDSAAAPGFTMAADPIGTRDSSRYTDG